MKKFITLSCAITLIASLMMLTNCGSPANTTGTPSYKVKTITLTGSTSVSYTCSYDASGRLATISGTSSGTPISVTYTYTSNTATETSSPSGFVTVYTLNSSGQAISDDQGNIYTYDANGYLVSKINTGSSYSLTNTISNGDIMSQNDNGVIHTYTYSTHTNKSDAGLSFKGKNTTHLEVTDDFNNGTAMHIASTFEFDASDRVTKQTQTGGSSGTTVTAITYY